MPLMPHRVFIVEDHADMRDAYRLLLDMEPDLEICAQVPTAEDALDRLTDCDADIVIVDLSLPKMSGLDLLRILRTRHTDVPVLIVSGHDQAFYATRSLEAGAHGYVDKNDMYNIGTAIRQVLQGHIYLSNSVQRPQ